MLFNPSQVYMPNRHRQPSALRTFFPSSSFSPPDSLEPLRRGILFSGVAAVLMLIGAILTWLGFNDVFGGKISMTGPLLIALALLMMLLSLRQFMLARKRNRSPGSHVQMDTVSTGGVTAVVVDHDDGNGAATIVVEAWESEEPNNDTLSYRNSHDLAPPSYMDIAQSCSSNCPSFISHDDHNEAPPTYEETCGIYNSQSSLTTSCSRRCSFQNERSPSPNRTSHSGYSCFQNEHSFSDSCEMYDDLYQPPRPPDIQCAKPSTSVSQPVSYHTPVICPENNSLPMSPPLMDSSHLARNTVGHNNHFMPHTPECVGSSVASCVTSTKPSEWSRRSFSSIPSYTCLLSESGEVSSHVFDTSSIIEEMMPLLVAPAKNRDPATPSDLLIDQTIIPTRSHSMSSVTSVKASRQGVPYNSQIHSSQTTPRTDTQIHSSQATPRTDTQLHSSQTTPRTDTQPIEHPHYTHPITETSSSSSCNHGNTSGVVSKSTSPPLYDDKPIQGRDQRLLDLLAAQPLHVTGPALLQPLPVGTVPFTSSFPSSRHISNTEEINEHEELLPLLESLDERKLESSHTAASQDSSAPVRGMLSNTQDVQETI